MIRSRRDPADRHKYRVLGAPRRTGSDWRSSITRRTALPLRTALRRCWTDTSAVAALEFAATAPLLLMMFGGVTDLSIAIWDHLTTSAAVQAGADYALYSFSNNPPTSSTGVGPMLTSIGAIVTAASRTGTSLSVSSVTVTYNNAANGGAFGYYYCLPQGYVAGSAFPSPVSGPGGSCADGTTSGAFVQISATYNYTPLSPLDAPFLSGNYTDTAIIRVQ